VTAYLAEVGERNSGPSIKFGTICGEDVPRLLAAVKAALARHRPVEYTGIRCATCYLADGGKAFWPCDTYQAISRALLGEGETDGH
jgi:hypothetical protein